MDKPNNIFLFLLFILSIAAGLYVYRPQGLYFIADDFIHIPESISNLLTQRNSLRPMGNISLHIDYLFSGKSSLGYHLTNLLLHVVNSIFVFFLCRGLIKKYAIHDSVIWFPSLAAITFFIYPFHSESIFWIIGRSGSLGALFFLPALILFLQRQKSIWFFLGSLVFFELALLSYESSWIFPLLVMVISYIDMQFDNVSIKKLLPYIIMVWLLFVLTLGFRSHVTGEVFNSYDTSTILHFNIRPLALNALRLFGRTMLPPFQNTQWLIISFFVALMFIIALIVKFYRHRQPKQLFILLTAFWLLSYLPYLSLGIDTHGTEGERYLYLPSVFFCLWLMYVLHRIVNREFQLAFATVFLFASILFLHQSRSYYTRAGAITKTTFDELGKLGNKQMVFVENLPQYYRGAVIFRLGFEEGVKWLQPSFGSQVTILSIDSSDQNRHIVPSNNFVVDYKTSAVTRSIGSTMVKDSSFRTNYIKSAIPAIGFDLNKHALLVYSDTVLTIIK